jgi:hypothetical protein
MWCAKYQGVVGWCGQARNSVVFWRRQLSLFVGSMVYGHSAHEELVDVALGLCCRAVLVTQVFFRRSPQGPVAGEAAVSSLDPPAR